MEENVQRVLAFLISILIFFIFPIYISFEKKDDVSYALALKVTTEFVDKVKSNGFLTENMYIDFINRLSSTSNSYDIKFEHKAYKYNPVINIYEIVDELGNVKLKNSYDFELYKTQFYNNGLIEDEEEKAVVEYNTSLEVYTEKQILKAFEKEKSNLFFNTTDSNAIINEYKRVQKQDIMLTPNIYAIKDLNGNYNSKLYTFNEGDEFNVIVTSINTTIAQMLFNQFTLYLGKGNVPRVYVNYGGIISGEKYKDN